MIYTCERCGKLRATENGECFSGAPCECPRRYAIIGKTKVDLDHAFAELTEELSRCERITGADLMTRIHG